MIQDLHRLEDGTVTESRRQNIHTWNIQTTWTVESQPPEAVW